MTTTLTENISASSVQVQTEMKRKVLLVNPRKGWRPALGLLYIGQYLIEAGYEVKVIEFIDESFHEGANDDLWKELFAYDADFYGFGVISWNRRITLDQIDRIRKQTKDKVIVCGGKDPTFNPNAYLDASVDYCVFGEGEFAMVELLDAINEKAPQEKIDQIQGLIFNKNGVAHFNEKREPPNIETLHRPALDLVDYKHYCDIRLGGIPGHFVNTGFMMANRGCPYKCKFCTDEIRKVYRERTIENIVDEMEWQKEKWNVDGITFLDDLFMPSPKRMRKFCEEVLRRNLKLKLYAQTRVDRVDDDELLQLMRKAGFIQLALGVETGSQRLLNIISKGTKLDQIHQAVERIKRAGIDTYCFLMVGIPEEEEEDLQATMKFVESARPTFVTVNYFMPMPGTPYFNENDKYALEELTFSLTAKQDEFKSKISANKILDYRSKFLALAEKRAEANLFRYPSFYAWCIKLVLTKPHIFIREIIKQSRHKVYNSYFEAIRTAMINNRIYGI